MNNMNQNQETQNDRKRPDFDLVFMHQGEFIRVGCLWSNNDREGQKAVVEIDTLQLPQGERKIRAYVCPKRTRAARPGGAA
jgi:hypothetical protein